MSTASVSFRVSLPLALGARIHKFHTTTCPINVRKSIPKRAYTQKARAESAADTRRRIIEVTRELLARAPLENVSLPEIAARAAVARSTVYTIFGSREGLMVAVAEDLLERGGFARIGQALRGPDVVRALEISIDVAMELYAQEHAVGQALLSLAAVDRDASSAAARLNFGRRDGMRRLAERMQAQGVLRDDVTAAEAADILWVVTSFETFAQLYRGRELTPEQVGARLLAIVRRTLYRPDLDDSRPRAQD
jgi:AcrR family transcriptional regulator